MTGDRVALDTNRAIAVLNGRADVVAWIGQFATICLPVPALGELRYGAMNSRQAAANLAAVNSLAVRCLLLEVHDKTADVYAQLRVDLKQKGRPIPENDLWIASLCGEHGVPLATDDSHFAAVAGLIVLGA